MLQSYTKKERSLEEVAAQLAKQQRQWYALRYGAWALLGLSVVANLSWGSVPIPLPDIADTLLYRLSGGYWGTWHGTVSAIIWEIRLPRLWAAVLTGGGLAIAGAVMQGHRL